MKKISNLGWDGVARSIKTLSLLAWWRGLRETNKMAKERTNGWRHAKEMDGSII
jgi:hypothetical protein